MAPREVVIVPEREGKGRSFSSVCVASVQADSLWEGGSTKGDNERPVWAMFAGTQNELRPFAANLQMGKKAVVVNNHRRAEQKIEFLRSAGYRYTWQHEAEGSLLTVFLPDLFAFDAGMVDPMGITFITLPPARWAREQQDLDVKRAVRHVARFGYKISEDALAALVPTSYLFVANLDRRTRGPIPMDGRFYLQLLCACLDQGLAAFSQRDRYASYHSREFGMTSVFGFLENDTASVGLLPGIAFRSPHDAFEKLLAEQVGLFFNKGTV